MILAEHEIAAPSVISVLSVFPISAPPPHGQT